MGIFDFLGYKDPAKDASKYYNKIPDQLKQYLEGYTKSGKNAMGQLEGEYGDLIEGGQGYKDMIAKLMENPSEMMDLIGKGYKESPGYQRNVEQATGASNRAAAAGGMLGSSAQQENLAGSINDIASKDYGDYMDRSLKQFDTALSGAGGLYGKGLSGLEGINEMGYGASKDLGESLSNFLASQGNLAFASGQGKNQGINDLLKSLMGAAGSFGGGSQKPWWL